MKTETSSIWKKAINNGVIAGGICLLVALVGLVEAFGDTYVIIGVISFGIVILFTPMVMLTYMFLRGSSNTRRSILVGTSALIGLISGLFLTILILLGTYTGIRNMFVNASPALFEMLTMGIPLPLGVFVPPLLFAVVCVATCGIFLLPSRLRAAMIQAILWVVALGTLRDQVLYIDLFKIQPFSFVLTRFMFATTGLSIIGAVFVFAVAFGLTFYLKGRQRGPAVAKSPKVVKRNKFILYIGLGLILLSLPYALGIFYSEILDTTGYFIIMGLGLNIVVGYAGLLDLGYVAFYAIGAYTVGVLTSQLGAWTFWQALPVALVVTWLAGIILGLPVLRMRGDYLAIVTLGFGEIVRLLALSDWLKSFLGGTQGIQQIAQPKFGPLTLDTLQKLYYIILVGIVIIAFIAWRLKDSHLGRSWMALREDEDVAQAMGINLVMTKLLAFSTGALFAGLAGTFGAAKLTSVYPHSMTFIVSINVLVMIIIGGMGSIPGVFVGALVLVGLPAMLSGFEEFKYWFYGLALVAMMLFRPEGLWP
ncbi:MAG: leucine/isoleucine/valine transporter permease subunit, partial [Anaerolineae bacterium]|nr:leucine/isoleucine/valine transporter permease subunit [Anaerolineae bacterium]